MRMYAEVVDRMGAVLIRLESDAENGADLTTLVAAVNKQFRKEFPRRSLLAHTGKAGYMIRIGAAPAVWH